MERLIDIKLARSETEGWTWVACLIRLKDWLSIAGGNIPSWDEERDKAISRELLNLTSTS